MDGYEIEISGDRYRVQSNDDDTLTVTSPDGSEHLIKRCTIHTDKEHEIMMDAGVYC